MDLAKLVMVKGLGSPTHPVYAPSMLNCWLYLHFSSFYKKSQQQQQEQEQEQEQEQQEQQQQQLLNL